MVWAGGALMFEKVITASKRLAALPVLRPSYFPSDMQFSIQASSIEKAVYEGILCCTCEHAEANATHVYVCKK